MNYGIQAGIINGAVNPTFNLPPERRETPPQPSIVIPFARDADFIERGTLLDKLCKRRALPDARHAIVGLGGVGKSQLAIEHAYRTREASPGTWVLWAHASSTARLEQSFRDIADRVKIAGRQDPEANIFKLVHDWLCDSKQPWLLVLDNVDDAGFLLDAETASSKNAAKPLREYFPHCERGSILVTTRNIEAALQLVEQRDIIALDPMSDLQAQTLLRKKLGVQATSGNAAELTELATVLEHMPLALVQAAAYISQRAPLCSVAQYLDQFRKSERKRMSLLNHDKGQLRRDREAKNSIITTWQISFEHIQQTRPSAADLLSLMSFFDRQGIPETLLQYRAKQGDAPRSQEERGDDDWDSDEEDGASQSSAGDDSFEQDVVTLRNFCFISVDTNGTSFEMHALVQLATRKWLDSSGRLERWKQQFISNLCAAFPTGEYENWTACQALFAHAKAAVGQRPEEKLSLVEWATLLYRAAWYAEKIGNIADATTLAVKAMKVRKKVLGQEHEDTLWSIAMVGLAYKLGGRWNAAEELEVQVMETCKTKLGTDHRSTLISMANLALTYWNQGRWDDAEKLEVQIMETCKTKLGADHLDTLTSMANLASTYRDQGRWGVAEKLEVQVMETRKTKLGADHPDTLTSMANLAMANLASTYWNQGRWDDAEKLFMQVMETRKTKLGADHPDTLTSMNNLAFTWKGQGRDAEAIDLMRECAQLRQQMLRADHPDSVSSSVALAQWKAEQAVPD
ncbi:TPR-like protein [Bimuria novae-zelandiae CBS 107.79]|uniref:TPR-like protein n=1 Tax=Bimuria novae-zelandiae CBS 107.79 TaxID=1447943 RepID=A0A6A5VCY4_9PLEO|nr:TPR-like protein [Bimuria novae-zelandiae CBS 107.79]